MACAFIHHQLRGHSGFLKLGNNGLRLLDRHQFVGIAVDNERRRVVGRYVIDGGNLSANLAPLFFIGNQNKSSELRIVFLEIKRGSEIFQRSSAQCLFAFLAIVQKIRRWEKAGDSLDPAGDLVDRVLGFGIAPGLRTPFS